MIVGLEHKGLTRRTSRKAIRTRQQTSSSSPPITCPPHLGLKNDWSRAVSKASITFWMADPSYSDVPRISYIRFKGVTRSPETPPAPMASDIPFQQTDGLFSNQSSHPPHQSTSHVPNEPLIAFDDGEAVGAFLNRELSCTLLDNLYPHLYYVARKSEQHVEPIHRHVLKGRNLIISEQVSLHLVWSQRTIYLKPIPHCLFSYEFWERHLIKDGQLPQTAANRRAALGLLRSYSRLIQHESDYLLAKEVHLVPSQSTYSQFQRFIQHFRRIPDQDVALRYRYGQFRLTRLQFTLRSLKLYRLIILPSRAHEIPWGYEYKMTDSGKTGSIVGWLVAPFIGCFAVLSIVLSSMQVLLGAQTSAAWIVICKQFALVVLVALTVLCFIFFGVLLVMFGAQFHYGWSQKAGDKEQSPC